MLALSVASAGPPAAGSAAARRRLPPVPLPLCSRSRQPQQPARAASSSSEPLESGPQDADALLQRAAHLRAEQQRLEREAASLAASLKGLPSAQQRVVLEALGLQRQQQQAQQQKQQAAPTPLEAAPQGQQQQQPSMRQRAAAGAQAEPPLAAVQGSDDWLAALPPHLQQEFKQSGLAAALQEQAEAVQREQEWAGSEEFGGGDMEALARMIEEGQELPPMPAQEWEREPEPADEFRARLQGSIDYMNADLKGSKHPKQQKQRKKKWQEQQEAADGGQTEGEAAAPGGGRGDGGAEAQEGEAGSGEVGEELQRQIAAAEAAAEQHTSDTFATWRAGRMFAGRPDLAAAYARGWSQSKRWDKMWESGEAEEEVMTEEVRRSVPAPPLPPDVRLVFKAAERIAYVLRRAHMDSTDPDAPLLALQSKGLVSEQLLLQDPFIQCQSLDRALNYMKRLRLAGAKLDLSTLMLRCGNYSPQMEWKVTIDCFLDLPYPPWFYGWVALNQGASSAAASSVGAAPGPLALGAAASLEAAEAAAVEERRRIEEQDAALAVMLLEAAQAAAEAAGRPLDDQAVLSVMKTAAGVALRRQREQEAAEAAQAAASMQASAEADEAMEEEARQPGGAPWRDPDPADLAPAELVGVHSEPYVHDGQKRRHRWVLLDFEKRHRQLGRQQFDVYPRHPPAAAAAEEEEEEEEEEEGGGARAGAGAQGASAQQQQQLGEEWDEEAEEARFQEEVRRQYRLLLPAALLAEDWGREGQQQAQQQQPLQQQAQQQPLQQQQQAQEASRRGSGSSGSGSGVARASSKTKRRRDAGAGAAAGSAGAAEGPAPDASGSTGSAQRRDQQQAQPQQEPEQESVEEEEEELFPFVFDWERQRRRQEAGRELRQVLGANFDKAMAQLPHMGRTRGRNSNATLNQEADEEGTGWLGGECMTVQATFTYTMDASSCLVDTVGITWGAVHGLHLLELTDVFDVYLEATGLLHEAECAQDEEEEEELRQQGVVVTRRDASKRGVAEGQRVGRSACWRPISRQVAQQQEQADEGQQ